MNNTTNTAATEYRQRAAISKDILKRTAARLSEHEASQDAAPMHWGFAGDLGRVNEGLAQVLAFPGDRSGIEEPGLRY
jgi:hypothetical protein